MLYSLLVSSLAYTSCTKEEDITLQHEEATVPNANARLVDQLLSTQIDNPAVYKGMYVDNFNLILGNTTSENNLINYAVANGLNTLSFYGLKSIVSQSSKFTQLANFLSRCSQNGITNRVYVTVYYAGSNNSSDSTYIKNYNNSRASASEKITGINMEWEWWNGATSWATYALTLKAYYNWTRRQTPAMTNEVYFGWFKNPTSIPSTMANELVKYCDRILLHDYRVAPDVSYMKSRMDYLGQAAISQAKTEKIVVLFSIEPSFMGPYCSTHTFDAAYQSIVSQYNAVSFTGKSGLRVQGWQLFNYRYAKQYRP